MEHGIRRCCKRAVDGMRQGLRVVSRDAIGNPMEITDAADQRSETDDVVVAFELQRMHRTHVAAYETKSLVAIEVVRDRAVFRKIVYGRDLVAALDQPPNDVRPDKSASTKG